jgi:hypothetical protein
LGWTAFSQLFNLNAGTPQVYCLTDLYTQSTQVNALAGPCSASRIIHTSDTRTKFQRQLTLQKAPAGSGNNDLVSVEVVVSFEEGGYTRSTKLNTQVTNWK